MNEHAQRQVDALVEYLDNNPQRSVRQIARHLSTTFTYSYNAAYVIYLARNKWGEDILTCKYKFSRGCYVYSFAESAMEGHEYVDRRLRIVRGTLTNLVSIVDRIEAKFPDEMPAQTTAIREHLMDALSALDG